MSRRRSATRSVSEAPGDRRRRSRIPHRSRRPLRPRRHRHRTRRRRRLVPVPPARPKTAAGTTPPSDRLLLRRTIGGADHRRVAGLVDLRDRQGDRPRSTAAGTRSRRWSFPKPTTKITIPEGLDRHQIAEVVKDAGIKGDYMKATEQPPRPASTRPSTSAKDAPNLEGFLFPATYDDLPKKATVDDLVDAPARRLRAATSRRST